MEHLQGCVDYLEDFIFYTVLKDVLCHSYSCSTFVNLLWCSMIFIQVYAAVIVLYCTTDIRVKLAVMMLWNLIVF